MKILIEMNKPGTPYEKRWGFNPRAPMDTDLVECYVKKHFPKGYVIVDVIEMPPNRHGPYANSRPWFEYAVYGPFTKAADFVERLEGMAKKEARYSQLAFRNGRRWKPGAK